MVEGRLRRHENQLIVQETLGLGAMATAGKPPAENGGSSHELTPEQRAAFQKRSDEIGKRLEAAKGSSETLPKGPAGSGSGAGKGGVDGSAMGKALRISTELIGGILVGSLIGYLLDRSFGTTPLLFVVFFLLGSAAGMLNVIRSTASKPSASGGSPQAAKDDEDA